MCLANKNFRNMAAFSEKLKIMNKFSFPVNFGVPPGFCEWGKKKNVYRWYVSHVCCNMSRNGYVQTCECFSSSNRSRQFSSRMRIFRRLLFPLFHMLRATRYRRRPSGTVKGFPWSSWASSNEVRSYNFTMSSSTPAMMIYVDDNLNTCTCEKLSIWQQTVFFYVNYQ